MPPVLSFSYFAADIISAVQFDHSGDYLATGDQGGRVVLFERISTQPAQLDVHLDQRELSPQHIPPFEFRYLTEFQSHDPEFDYLKSLEIEEKINQVRWLRRWGASSTHSLLTTNDKTIKLWKVYEKRITCLSEFNLQNGSSTLNRAASVTMESPNKLAASALTGRHSTNTVLRVPKVVSTETVLASRCRRVYSAAHTYHINAISLSYDQETFISADDLRINLWNLDRADTSFNIVDIKPSSMEDLTEVITSADFHPQSSHIFAYSSSKGCIRLADMRIAALCDNHAKLFEDPDPTGPRSFFSDIIASINDVRFTGPSGDLILSRDYMTLKLWDVRSEAAPIEVIPVQEPLRQRLSDLYESDAIFDKFSCCSSGDGQHYATGTYSNFFRVAGRGGSGSGSGGYHHGTLLEASRDPMRRRLQMPAKIHSRFVGFGRGPVRVRNGGGSGGAPLPAEDAITTDLSARVTHLSWHPSDNVIATAAQNSLYVFHGKNPSRPDFW